MLRVRGLSKRFGANPVLDAATFAIHEGEVLGLIGPNGSGKTTLFECLAGLIPSDSGEVIFRGAPLPPGRRKHAMFYLPDGIRPWADQTAGWVLRFFEALFGGSGGLTSALLHGLQLRHVEHSRIGSLSKGELKRTMLAVGLLAPHPLLLLDEPFDGLDLRQVREAIPLLRSYSAGGRTLFVSIHQLTDAERVCDRLILLNRGRVAGTGTLAELRNQAGLVHGGLEEIFLALT